MSETTETPIPPGLPPARPDPTHVVEVYLQEALGFVGAARADRFFFADEMSAESVYQGLQGRLQARLSKDNDLPTTTEIDDLYGSGTVVTADLRGCRLIAFRDLDDYSIARDARAHAAKLAAVKLPTDGSE